MARELHDSLAHHLSGVAIQARAAKAVLPENSKAGVHLDEIANSTSTALLEVREVVRVLREDANDEPAPRQPHNLDEIRAMESDEAGGPKVTVDMSGPLENLSQPVQQGLYRMAQEAITNATRHAKNARLVQVVVVGSKSDVRLTVLDDGDMPLAGGIDGYGLVGMSERANLLGGTFEAGPRQPNGWQVEVVLPKRAGGTG